MQRPWCSDPVLLKGTWTLALLAAGCRAQAGRGWLRMHYARPFIVKAYSSVNMITFYAP